VKRITAVADSLAFIVTTLFLLFTFGLVVSAPGGLRDAVPELILFGVALIAFLLAGLMARLAAEPEPQTAPVEVRIENHQVDLIAAVVDSVVAGQTAAAAGLPKPIPRLQHPEPVRVSETKLPRHRAKV